MGNKVGFGYRSTAEDVTKDVDASGITAIVTGATSGIGKETARVLALRGAHVFVSGRSVESATKAKDEIAKQVPNAKLDILEMDLSSQRSVVKGVQTFNALDKPLNLLVNNAGIMMTPYELTTDGIESQFATNHMGHYLLTTLLLDKLVETANKTQTESRIVIVSSAAIAQAPKKSITWEKVNDKESYSTYGAYGLSKIANLYHAQELARRIQENGVTNVTANSLHPGVIWTDIGRHNKLLLYPIVAVSWLFWKSIPQGAATTCYVALHPSLKGVSGKFFADSKEKDPKDWNPLAENVEIAKQLWDYSSSLWR